MRKIQLASRGGFTLIELLIVIAIIGILASVILVSLNSARTRARNAKRIREVSQIQSALEVYYTQFGQYPDGDNDGCGGWDVGNSTRAFIPSLAAIIGQALPRDMTRSDWCEGYFYYRYPANYEGCTKAFYVLGTQVEGGASSISPGWSCPTRNWQNELGWVTGKFEN